MFCVLFALCWEMPEGPELVRPIGRAWACSFDTAQRKVNRYSRPWICATELCLFGPWQTGLGSLLESVFFCQRSVLPDCASLDPGRDSAIQRHRRLCQWAYNAHRIDMRHYISQECKENGQVPAQRQTNGKEDIWWCQCPEHLQ